jgi:3-oxoadipate enol-lactonase
MPTATIHSGTLYYEVHGGGPPLVFAHGVGGNHLSWWQQVPHFRDRYTCVTFDAPGFGRSEHPPGEWSFVDSLAGLIDHLGFEQVRLVAQSMGGRACLGYALERPERVAALVMSATSGAVEFPEFAAPRAETPARREELARRGIHPACGERMAREQPALHFLYQEISALNPTPWSPTNRPGGSERVPTISRQTLQRLRVPVLYVIAEEDAAWPPAILELAAAATPSARVARVAQAGHSVYFERPAEFNRLVDGFLADTAG